MFFIIFNVTLVTEVCALKGLTYIVEVLDRGLVIYYYL